MGPKIYWKVDPAQFHEWRYFFSFSLFPEFGWKTHPSIYSPPTFFPLFLHYIISHKYMDMVLGKVQRFNWKALKVLVYKVFDIFFNFSTDSTKEPFHDWVVFAWTWLSLSWFMTHLWIYSTNFGNNSPNPPPTTIQRFAIGKYKHHSKMYI